MEKKIELKLRVLKDDIETVQIVLAATPKKPNEHVILLPNKYGEYKDGEMVKVVISPVQSQESFVPQDKPDYEAMLEEMEGQVRESRKAIVRSQFNMKLEELLEKVRAKHTPQGDQGVKEEQT